MNIATHFIGDVSGEYLRISSADQMPFVHSHDVAHDLGRKSAVITSDLEDLGDEPGVAVSDVDLANGGESLALPKLIESYSSCPSTTLVMRPYAVKLRMVPASAR
jgi:hypothetical protein